MPKYTQPRKTWQYSNEFKVKAVYQSSYSSFNYVQRVDYSKQIDGSSKVTCSIIY
jgi:hypothetical protein